MSSKILKSERKYAFYLPPDYETSERSYPVLYLLHGAGEKNFRSYYERHNALSLIRDLPEVLDFVSDAFHQY